MKILIAVNGPTAYERDHTITSTVPDLVIAADGGSMHLEKMGITPDIALGDFDSIDPQLLCRYKDSGVEIHQHPVAKDATDLELALTVAKERGATEVTVIGAVGGRWDMSFANILVMANARFHQMDVTAVDKGVVFRILQPDREYSFSSRDGAEFSLIPLSEEVAGVTLQGFRYNLDNETLHFGSTRGLSNQIDTEPALSSHRNGVMLAIQQLEYTH